MWVGGRSEKAMVPEDRVDHCLPNPEYLANISDAIALDMEKYWDTAFQVL
jgi:hypothetical protein